MGTPGLEVGATSTAEVAAGKVLPTATVARPSPRLPDLGRIRRTALSRCLIPVGVAGLLTTSLMLPGFLAQLVTEKSAADTAESAASKQPAHATATTAVAWPTP